MIFMIMPQQAYVTTGTVNYPTPSSPSESESEIVLSGRVNIHVNTTLTLYTVLVLSDRSHVRPQPHLPAVFKQAMPLAAQPQDLLRPFPSLTVRIGTK